MNLQSPSNLYLIIIPKNYTNDIHICGRCKFQYTSLNLFLKHKETCKEDDFKELNEEEQSNKKFEIENPVKISSMVTLKETMEKESQINLLSNLIRDDGQLKQVYKIDGFEGQELSINPKENCLNESDPMMQQKTQLEIDCKRTLQNDEEDIATLLANQLSSETTTDDINMDVDIQPPDSQQNPLQESQHNLEKKDKDDKIMYRGKMRKLFSCQVEGCMYKTLLRKDIERHSRVHTGERPFKCFLCGKAFNRTDKLLLHERIHAGDKRYKCTKCDYASVDSGSLIKHLRVHNGERPFKCQLCSYRARDSSQLTVHLRTHTGDSPFICTNVKCKAAFKTNSDLKRHMVVHSEEKPHSCTYCPYKSTLKRNLQIHIQSQHPNGELKEYKCHLCPTFVLPTSRKLKNHIKKHHTPPEEKSTIDKTTLEQHILPKEGNVEKQETFKKRKRKARRNSDKIPVGVMNKAYDCKLCEASFVCQDSLVTHQRYHSKIEDAMRKSEFNQRNTELGSSKVKKVEEDMGKRVDGSFVSELGLSEGCVADSSFSDSLRNAEILASLNTSQGIGGVRQYVMVAPEALPNVYTTEEYVLVQN